MTESAIIKTEILSYLLTKAEYYSSDHYFKVKNLMFLEHSSRSLGHICADLMKDGLIMKVKRKHTPSIWMTNLMGNGGDLGK